MVQLIHQYHRLPHQRANQQRKPPSYNSNSPIANFFLARPCFININLLRLTGSLGRQEPLYSLRRWQNGGTEQDHGFSKVPRGTDASRGHSTGNSPSSQAPVLSRRPGVWKGMEALGKARWPGYESRHQRRHTRWTGKHTTAAVHSWDLPCPSRASDALLLFRRLVEELIKSQDKYLLAQVSLLCHLLQQYLTSPRKARAALQEAQKWYKPQTLKRQEEHPAGKHDFVEFTS